METGVSWNPWHVCVKYSEGCRHCYVYMADARYERDASQVRKTGDFGLPVKRTRSGEYKIPPGTRVAACFISDFLLDRADEWRGEAWRMMRERSDLFFLFITKRIERFSLCVPPDWGEGYHNVHICCTCENQEAADRRLPVFKAAPIRRKTIVCEPLLGPMDISAYLGPWVSGLVVGGESGPEARVCRYDWVLSLRAQAMAAGVRFQFRQTGARLEKDGRVNNIPRKFQHSQARKAGINT